MKKLLTTRELQNYLNIDRITIYRMLETGEIPAIRVGGQWRFDAEQIDQWLAERRTQPSVSPATPPVTSSLSSHEALSIAGRDLSELKVCDLIAPSCLEIIQGSFAGALGVATGISDLAGSPLVSFCNSCAFCEYGWSSPAFWQRCQASWSALATAPEKVHQLRFCHAGLNYTIAHLLVEGQKLGLVIAGQFLSSTPDDDFEHHISQIAKECGLNKNHLLAQIATIPVFDHERTQLITKLLITIASALSEIATQNYNIRTKLAQIAQIVGTT